MLSLASWCQPQGPPNPGPAGSLGRIFLVPLARAGQRRRTVGRSLGDHSRLSGTAGAPRCRRSCWRVRKTHCAADRSMAGPAYLPHFSVSFCLNVSPAHASHDKPSHGPVLPSHEAFKREFNGGGGMKCLCDAKSWASVPATVWAAVEFRFFDASGRTSSGHVPSDGVARR
jgi:hypothetical protein